MIKGLYEAHLPVSDIKRSVEFYQRLGLQVAHLYEDVAFIWIVPEVSWIALWQGEQVKTPYHPSLRHIAFHVEFEDMEQAREWLLERGIETRPDGGFEGTEPYVRPFQANVSLYFDDPDGNSLEFICSIPVPDEHKDKKKMYLSEWEAMIGRK